MPRKSEEPFPERIYVTRERTSVGDEAFLVVHEDMSTIESADAESVAIYHRVGVGKVRIDREFELGGP